MHQFSGRGDIDSWLIQGESNKMRARIVNNEISRRSEEVREIKRLGWRIYTLTQVGFIEDNVPRTKNRAHGVQGLTLRVVQDTRQRGNRENK